MPLYEYLIVTRAGSSKISVEILQDVVKAILTNHPSVRIREIQNLGDRIMGNPINKLKITYSIGRYLQIMLDAPPSVNVTIRKILTDKWKNELFRSSIHRVDDLDYAINTYFRAGKSIDPFTDVKDYEFAQKVMDMKEQTSKLD